MNRDLADALEQHARNDDLRSTVDAPVSRRAEESGGDAPDLTWRNSYHLGQIVLVRQLLGAWPPPGAGLTW